MPDREKTLREVKERRVICPLRISGPSGPLPRGARLERERERESTYPAERERARLHLFTLKVERNRLVHHTHSDKAFKQNNFAAYCLSRSSPATYSAGTKRTYDFTKVEAILSEQIQSGKRFSEFCQRNLEMSGFVQDRNVRFSVLMGTEFGGGCRSKA